MKARRITIGLGALVAVGSLLAACGGGAAPQAGGNAATGKTVFDANCSACHPGGGAGVGPALKGKEPDVVRKQVRNGGKQMPAIPASKVSDQQLEDVIAYIKTLK